MTLPPPLYPHYSPHSDPSKSGRSLCPTLYIAEIFLKNYEHKYIKEFLESKSIIFNATYVDDILIIFDKTKTNPQNINTYINKIHNNLKLTPHTRNTTP